MKRNPPNRNRNTAQETKQFFSDITGDANAYDASVDFWNDYGNNISEDFGQAGEMWNNVKSIPGFSDRYGGAVKGGDGIFTKRIETSIYMKVLTIPQNSILIYNVRIEIGNIATCCTMRAIGIC